MSHGRDANVDAGRSGGTQQKKDCSYELTYSAMGEESEINEPLGGDSDENKPDMSSYSKDW